MRARVQRVIRECGGGRETSKGKERKKLEKVDHCTHPFFYYNFFPIKNCYFHLKMAIRKFFLYAFLLIEIQTTNINGEKKSIL
mmetsp:Transcript_17284/g.31547  ORF Transcript_17284/g.31547 Transcript_17284/m.31547 type:complete len:83 (-) Transcript_17284:170-418(-)